jgi:hypothetical protein
VIATQLALEVQQQLSVKPPSRMRIASFPHPVGSLAASFQELQIVMSGHSNLARDYLRGQDAPTGRFDKDVGLISTHLREREYILESGLKVRGPDEAWDEHVEESQDEDNSLTLHVRSPSPISAWPHGEFLELLRDGVFRDRVGSSRDLVTLDCPGDAANGRERS